MPFPVYKEAPGHSGSLVLLYPLWGTVLIVQRLLTLTVHLLMFSPCILQLSYFG